MTKENDPMGRAIAEYQTTGRAERLRVFSPMFDEDEIPVATLFRDVDEMPAIEREALRLTRGATLDVGAGAGCHSLPLQARGIDVTAIDISPLAVETMRQRGVRQALNLVDHPELIGKRVKVKGDLVDKYFGTVGLKSTASYEMP